MKEALACQKNLENEVKLFTKEEKKDRIKENYTSLDYVKSPLTKKEWIEMEGIILEKIKFIEEDKYQQIKKDMKKNNDYFSQKELEQISVI